MRSQRQWERAFLPRTERSDFPPPPHVLRPRRRTDSRSGERTRTEYTKASSRPQRAVRGAIGAVTEVERARHRDTRIPLLYPAQRSAIIKTLHSSLTLSHCMCRLRETLRGDLALDRTSVLSRDHCAFMHSLILSCPARSHTGHSMPLLRIRPSSRLSNRTTFPKKSTLRFSSTRSSS